MAVSRNAEAAINGMIAARDHKYHISTLMLLRIVDHLSTSQEPATIGEILGYYKANRKDQSGAIDYTYGGVCSMLRKMKQIGLLVSDRNQKRLRYRPSRRGIEILDSMYM